jgi:gas vesicle protein
MSDEKSNSGMGKLLAGLLIGGAIGSVLGLALAPHDGKKNRKIMQEKAEEAAKLGQKILEENCKK